MTEMFDVATLGEALIVLEPTSTGAMRHASSLSKGVGGAEANVAVALARLGHRAAWAGSLGEDEFGEEIVGLLRSEGVDTSCVERDSHYPTGVYFKEHRALGNTRVFYYRSGSAASALSYKSIDTESILSAKILHMTGITPLLSETCAQTCRSLIREARSCGVTVSFDVNIRQALLGDRDPVETILPFVEDADIVFMSDAEARMLLGGDDEITAQLYATEHPYVTLIIHSADGSESFGEAGRATSKSYEVQALDTVGAGDAFVAGFLSGVLQGLETKRSLDLANACGACAITVVGDARSMPFKADATTLYENTGLLER